MEEHSPCRRLKEGGTGPDREPNQEGEKLNGVKRLQRKKVGPLDPLKEIPVVEKHFPNTEAAESGMDEKVEGVVQVDQNDRSA